MTHGRVRGKTIELDEDLGIPEGQVVEVSVRIMPRRKALPGPPPGWREGIASATAGVLADYCTDEDDRILEKIYRDRKRDTVRELAE